MRTWIASMAMVLALASAAPAADFYQGKQIGILVNFPTGGSTDLESRIMARHLPRHVPGAPSTVVRNMGGASGVTAMNWLAEIAAPDGLTFGYFTGAAAKTAFGEAGVRVDLGKFGFLANGPGVLVGYMRADVPPGLKTAGDILKARDFWAAGLLPGTDKDVRMRLSLELLGVKYKYISNYPGSAEARLAVERNEVQMYTESISTYRAAIEPNLMKTGIALPIWVDPIDDGESFSAPAEANGIPVKTFPDLYRELRGEFPKTIEWEAYRLTNFLGSTMMRTLVLPPGAPPEAAAILKKAIAELANDREFIDDCMKAMQFVPRYMLDDRAEKMFRKALDPDPRLKAFIAAYIEKGRAFLGK